MECGDGQGIKTMELDPPNCLILKNLTVCVSVHISAFTHIGQNKALDPLKLELQVVNHLTGM